MPALPARRPAPTLSGAHSPGAPKLVLSGPEDPVEVFMRIPSGEALSVWQAKEQVSQTRAVSS